MNSVGVAGEWDIQPTTDLDAGVATLFGSYTVPRGMMVQIGGGYAYVVPALAGPTRIEGMVRIYLQNTTGSEKYKVAEFHTSECQTQGNKQETKWLDPLPYVGKTDSLFLIEITADATAIATDVDSVVCVPCIKYDVA